MPSGDTIYALASAPGRAGVAVVRVSGPQAAKAFTVLAGRAVPEARRAVLVRLRDGAGGTIDRGLALWFAGPDSFTGEDICEFQVHGGPAVLEALLAGLAGIAGLRVADRGEFTRRAVENGKFDLTAAEGLIDLIDAETEAQRRQAQRQQEGALAALYEGWAQRLTRSLAWIEAGIDFTDGEIPDEALAGARADLGDLADAMQAHLRDGRRGELVRDGISIALVGAPNAGKSTLLNALVNREAAIVSATPGTTRDVIEVRLDLCGYAVTLADTAGLRAAVDGIEAEGIRRALARAEAADLVLLVLDTTAAQPFAGLPMGLAERADLVVWNKSDAGRFVPGRGELEVSAKTGEGLPALLERLTGLVRERLDQGGEAPVLTRSRHRLAVEAAEAGLRRALGAAPDAPELFAEDLRLALRAIGRITGRVDVEDLLDVIFRDFCVGK